MQTERLCRLIVDEAGAISLLSAQITLNEWSEL
jgi:hypothetical protein